MTTLSPRWLPTLADGLQKRASEVCSRADAALGFSRLEDEVTKGAWSQRRGWVAAGDDRSRRDLGGRERTELLGPPRRIQGMPQAALPPGLQETIPLGLARRVDGRQLT
jgi:hypothetical protein